MSREALCRLLARERRRQILQRVYQQTATRAKMGLLDAAMRMIDANNIGHVDGRNISAAGELYTKYQRDSMAMLARSRHRERIILALLRMAECTTNR